MFKKLINNKHVSYWLGLFVSLALPVGIIAWRYNFLERHIAYQIGLPVIFVLLWAFIKFWRDITAYVKTMEEGIYRELCLGIMKLGPYILLYLIALFLEPIQPHLYFISAVLLLTQAMGIGFHANHQRLKRKELKARGYVNVLPT